MKNTVLHDKEFGDDDDRKTTTMILMLMLIMMMLVLMLMLMLVMLMLRLMMFIFLGGCDDVDLSPDLITTQRRMVNPATADHSLIN